MRTRLLSLTAACLLAVAALALAACGSDSTSSTDLGPDPATMTPADTPFYMEAVLRPEGSLSDDLNSALGKLLVTDDVSGKIHDALDQSLAENGGHFTYENDIAPWLGTRAGFFVNGYDSRAEEVEGAAVVAVTDADAAQSFVDKAAAEGKEKTRQQDYKGVQLTVSSDNTAVGIDGDFLLAGSTQGVEDAIDAARRRRLRRRRRLDDRPGRRARGHRLLALRRSAEGARSRQELGGRARRPAQADRGPARRDERRPDRRLGLGHRQLASASAPRPRPPTTLPIRPTC